MTDADRTGEIQAGLAETRRYLLSHHEPEEYHRCYGLSVRGRVVRLCARCLGIYPGIAVGLAAFGAGVAAGYQTVLIAFLPAVALCDWTVTTFTGRAGRNSIRTLSGLCLGLAYGLGLGHVLIAGRLGVLVVGVGYASVAAPLLWLALRDGH